MAPQNMLSAFIVYILLVVCQAAPNQRKGDIWYPKPAGNNRITHYIPSDRKKGLLITTVFPTKLDARVEDDLWKAWVLGTRTGQNYMSRAHQVRVIYDGEFQTRTAISFFSNRHDKGKNRMDGRQWKLFVEDQRPFYDSRKAKYESVVEGYASERINGVPLDVDMGGIGYSDPENSEGLLAYPGIGPGQHWPDVEAWFLGLEGSGPVLPPNDELRPENGRELVPTNEEEEEEEEEEDDSNQHSEDYGPNDEEGFSKPKKLRSGVWFPISASVVSMTGYAKPTGDVMIILCPPKIDADSIVALLLSDKEFGSQEVKMGAHQVRVQTNPNRPKSAMLAESIRSAITLYKAEGAGKTTYEDWQALFWQIHKSMYEEWNFPATVLNPRYYRLSPIPDGVEVQGVGYDSSLDRPGPGPTRLTEDALLQWFGEQAVRKLKVGMDEYSILKKTWIPEVLGSAVVTAVARDHDPIMVVLFPPEIDATEEMAKWSAQCVVDPRTIAMQWYQLHANRMTPNRVFETSVFEAIALYNFVKLEETTYDDWRKVVSNILEHISSFKEHYHRLAAQKKAVLKVSPNQGLPNRFMGYDSKLDHPGPAPSADLDEYFGVTRHADGTATLTGGDRGADEQQGNACEPGHPDSPKEAWMQWVEMDRVEMDVDE